MPPRQRFYDPLIQTAQPAGERVELYPDEHGKWHSRRVNEAAVLEIGPGDFNYDEAHRQATLHWPDLEIFQVANETDDSMWQGPGPSPRMWQTMPQSLPPAVEPDPPLLVRGLDVPAAGVYINVADAAAQLRGLADEYDEAGNPSAAVALRQVADAWT